MTRTLFAAGGVLWRGDAEDPQIALVHRPEYDDWSLPKGKSKPREHRIVTALREVTEETGIRPQLGRFLTTVRYLNGAADSGVTKEVSYWSMRATPGGFVPSEEVDELRWLDFDDARRSVTSALDRAVLDAFADVDHDTTPVLLLRHGETSSGSPDRPAGSRLSRVGRAQAAALVPICHGIGVDSLVSDDLPACVETLHPFAATAGLTVHTAGLHSGEQRAVEAVAQQVRGNAGQRCATVVCAARDDLTRVLSALMPRRGSSPPGQRVPGSAGGWLLHLSNDDVRACETYEPAA